MKREKELEWMDRLIAWINEYQKFNPRNRGSYRTTGHMPTIVPIHLRKGIIFYSDGRGWRLRKEWQSVLRQRMESLERAAGGDDDAA